MIPEQLIEVKINSNTKKYYEQLGFNQKVGNIIYVTPAQLMLNSMAIEKRICDCCGEEYSAPHQSLVKSHNSFNKNVCPNCFKNNEEIKKEQSERRKKTNLEKYGTIAPAQNQKIKDKIIKHNLEEYGVRSTLEIDEVKNKIKMTLLQKYGVDNPMKSSKIIQKAKETNLKKYGAENPMQNQDVLNKAINTNLQKYGVKSTAQVPEIREKMLNSLYRNGTIPTSSQQLALFDMVKNMYPDAECILNYPLSKISLDIRFVYKGIMIDIEYDGQYWHQDKKKDFARDCFTKSQGYKVLRIKSKSMLPTIEELKNVIDLLISTKTQFKELILSDWD